MSLVLHRSLAWARRGHPIRDRSRIAAAALGVILSLCASVPAFSQDTSKSLSEDQVLTLLKEDPAPRVQYLVNKYGIGFYLTPDTENDLRNAGATQDLIDLVRRLAPQKPAEVKPP